MSCVRTLTLLAYVALAGIHCGHALKTVGPSVRSVPTTLLVATRSQASKKYMPANYTEANDVTSKKLHGQVFNTSKMMEGPMETGAARREVWSGEQKILKEKQDARLKNISDCINAEEKLAIDNFKICNDTRTKNAAAGEGEDAKECAAVENPPNIYELCDQPPIPINITTGDFGNELMELVQMHTELETGIAGWQERALHEEMDILSEVRRFYSARSVLSTLKDREEAKKHSLKEAERMQKYIAGLIKAREATWVQEKNWFWSWTDQANVTAHTLCDANISHKCEEHKVRLVKEGEQDTVKAGLWALYRRDNESADNSPWALPYMRDFAAYLPNETADIANATFPHKDSWWTGTKMTGFMAGFAWDERRANDLAVMDGLETIIQTGERYFDYHYANLLMHIGVRKGQITEMRIQPALREVGMIPTEPDLGWLENLQAKIELLHKVSRQERRYHWEEQSRLWSLVPFLDAAIRDLDRPAEVHEWCQKTSLRWYKCRQSLRQFLDYLQEMLQFLNSAAKPLRATANSLTKAHPLFASKEQFIEPVGEANTRLDVLYETWKAVNKAQEVARGDGNKEQLEEYKTKVMDELKKAHAHYQGMVGKAATWSREYQIRTTRRIIDLMDEKNDNIEYMFYGGGSEMANDNRAAYSRMASPTLMLLNVTGLDARINFPKSKTFLAAMPSGPGGVRSFERFLKVPTSELPKGSEMLENAPVARRSEAAGEKVSPKLSGVLELLRQGGLKDIDTDVPEQE